MRGWSPRDRLEGGGGGVGNVGVVGENSPGAHWRGDLREVTAAAGPRWAAVSSSCSGLLCLAQIVAGDGPAWVVLGMGHPGIRRGGMDIDAVFCAEVGVSGPESSLGSG